MYIFEFLSFYVPACTAYKYTDVYTDDMCEVYIRSWIYVESYVQVYECMIVRASILHT